MISIVPWLSPFSLNHTSLYGLINNEQVNIEEMVVSGHDTPDDDSDDVPGMGVYFFEKSLSFLRPALCVVFKILKFTQKFGPKLGFFQKNRKKFQEMRKMNKKLGKIA